VLDVGTGTGLLVLDARRRAGAEGLVVGIDVSEDCLRECAREAEAADQQAARLLLVQGDAVRLPFADSSFDAVTTRSVLAYVEDRRRAVEELHRVLRPGGRASVFEPVNKVYVAPNVRPGDPALSSIQPEHDRVVAHLDARSRFRERMDGFDERDLLREFEDAGFETVTLAYEHHHEGAHRGARWEAQTFVSTRPNPGTISYAEAARGVLGATADEHLERFVAILSSGRYRLAWAVAYIAAVK
jgi:arsenite methyltransferase